MTSRSRFRTALEREGLAFAPLLWKRLPSLVRQERADWWQDPATGQRLIADAAAMASADAMFVFVAAEAVSSVASEGSRGDAALDALAGTPAAVQGVELVQCLSDVAQHATIAAVPAPPELLSELEGEQIEVAEDAFSRPRLRLSAMRRRRACGHRLRPRDGRRRGDARGRARQAVRPRGPRRLPRRR